MIDCRQSNLAGIAILCLVTEPWHHTRFDRIFVRSGHSVGLLRMLQQFECVTEACLGSFMLLSAHLKFIAAGLRQFAPVKFQLQMPACGTERITSFRLLSSFSKI